MDYLVEAYLDDYQKITVKIKRRFHNGISDVFFIQNKKDIYPLTIASTYETDNEIEYSLKYDFDLQIPLSYQVVVCDGYRVALQYRFIVKTERFNKEYAYSKNDLGCVVEASKTTFKVWAPTATNMYLKLNQKFYEMKYNKGVYKISFNENLIGQAYQYLVNVNGNTYLTNDPYAKASLLNNDASVLVKSETAKINKYKEYNYTDAVIYETSIRDFSKEGTFNSFDIDRLIDLGITHLQLLPIQDFASVDEYHKDLFYNWGYDPLNYQCIEGSYSSNTTKPTQVIEDFKCFVDRLHNHKIKINLDIVFNHHYNAQVSCFNRLVPYYYFRYENGVLSDGTYCGNEFDSQMLMTRKYFIDTLLYYVTTFDVDGFRFDLMNFIDIETMKLITHSLYRVKKSIMLYGEGWNMDSPLVYQQRSLKENKDQLEKIAFFNDDYRDTMLGNTFDLYNIGFISGDDGKTNHALECIINDDKQLINYVQCHDNYTALDRLRAVSKDEIEAVRRCQLANAIVLLSKGIPFINAYQEYGISKNNIGNCYNVKDEINKLINHPQNLDIYKAIKDVIKFRKESKFYHCPINNQYIDNGVIIIDVDKYTLIINVTNNDYLYHFDGDKIVVISNESYIDDKIKDSIKVKALSYVVLEG